MKEILKKLAAVQSALKAPKGQYNSYGGYNYRSCEDILEAVKPLLREQALTMAICDSVNQIGDRYYITATVTLYDNESGESFSNSAQAREEETKKGMDSSQITGTASSYARKYALNGLFLIDDTKDADSNEYKQQQQNSPAPAPAPQAPPPVICPKCGKPVKGAKKKNGELIHPAQVLENCGGMCAECYKAAKAEKK